ASSGPDVGSPHSQLSSSPKDSQPDGFAEKSSSYPSVMPSLMSTVYSSLVISLLPKSLIVHVYVNVSPSMSSSDIVASYTSSLNYPVFLSSFIVFSSYSSVSYF